MVPVYSGLRPANHGWLRRTTPDDAGLLPVYYELRQTTSGLLQSTRPDTGVLNTRPEDQPGHRGNYLLDFLSPLCRFGLHLVAGLGRESLIYNGGAPPYAGLWPALSGPLDPN